MIHENLKVFLEVIRSSKMRHSFIKMQPTRAAMRFTCFTWPEGTIHKCDVPWKVPVAHDNPFSWMVTSAWVEKEKKNFKLMMVRLQHLLLNLQGMA
jgi:hypothetical protein